MPDTFQNSFNNGEISEDAHARPDVARTRGACRVAENVVTLPVGGAEARDGFLLKSKTHDSTKKARLIPYDAGSDARFMLEFGDLVMRVYQNGSLLTTGVGAELVTNGDFATGISSWTDLSTGTGIFEHHPLYKTARLKAPALADVAWMQQAITCTIGAKYELRFAMGGIPAGETRLRIGSSSGGAELGNILYSAGSHIVQFTATATTMYIQFTQEYPTANLGIELVKNGDFTAGITDWDDKSLGMGLAFSPGASLGLRSWSDTGPAAAEQAITTLPGKTYTITFDILSQQWPLNNSSQLHVGSTSGGTDLLLKTSLANGSHSYTFTATGTTSYIRAYWPGLFGTILYSYWDNFSVLENDFGLHVDNVSVKQAGTPYGIVTPYTEDDLADLQFTQLDDGLLIQSESFKLRKLVPVGVTNWTLTETDWIKVDKIPGATGTAIGSMTSGGGLAAGFDGDTYKAAAVCAAGAAGGFNQQIGKDWGVGVTKNLRGVSIFSSNDQSFWNESGAEMVFKVQGSNDNFAGDINDLAEFTIQTDTSKITKLEIFNLNDIRTPYRYHRADITVKSDNGALGISLAEIEFYEAVAANPPGLNDSSATYAQAIGKYQQRVITGGQSGRRLAVYGSAVGEPLNLGVGDANDNDSFEYDLDGSGEIKWFFGSDGLLIGTDQSIWRGRGTQGPLSPNDRDFNPDVKIGASSIVPAQMGNSVLFIQNDRERVRAVRIDDQGVKLTENDLSILADHIGQASPFAGMAVQEDPNKVCWLYRDDGEMVGVTYNQTESVYGWHRHPMSNGKVESLVPLVGTTGKTEIWAIINRTVNGVTVRTVEIMKKGVYLDGAVEYSFALPGTELSGLDHLEGETVSAYGDGGHLGSYVVSGGSVIVDTPVMTAQVGKNFIPKVVPVSPARGVARKTSFASLAVKVRDCTNLWVNGRRHLFRRGFTALDQAEPPFTGIKQVVVLGWDYEPTITFERRIPGPWALLGYRGTIEGED